MAMFHLLKIRTSIDILENETCKVTFGLEYINLFIHADHVLYESIL